MIFNEYLSTFLPAIKRDLEEKKQEKKKGPHGIVCTENPYGLYCGGAEEN